SPSSPSDSNHSPSPTPATELPDTADTPSPQRRLWSLTSLPGAIASFVRLDAICVLEIARIMGLVAAVNQHAALLAGAAGKNYEPATTVSVMKNRLSDKGIQRNPFFANSLFKVLFGIGSEIAPLLIPMPQKDGWEKRFDYHVSTDGFGFNLQYEVRYPYTPPGPRQKAKEFFDEAVAKDFDIVICDPGANNVTLMLLPRPQVPPAPVFVAAPQYQNPHQQVPPAPAPVAAPQHQNPHQQVPPAPAPVAAPQHQNPYQQVPPAPAPVAAPSVPLGCLSSSANGQQIWSVAKDWYYRLCRSDMFRKIRATRLASPDYEDVEATQNTILSPKTSQWDRFCDHLLTAPPTFAILFKLSKEERGTKFNRKRYRQSARALATNSIMGPVRNRNAVLVLGSANFSPTRRGTTPGPFKSLLREAPFKKTFYQNEQCTSMNCSRCLNEPSVALEIHNGTLDGLSVVVRLEGVPPPAELARYQDVSSLLRVWDPGVAGSITDPVDIAIPDAARYRRSFYNRPRLGE
ncbi:hypothetical protein HDV05_001127, partial [Chytridiales sp. JEL 0842]